MGVNTWVIHRNQAVFGSDADSYRPERWIDNPELVVEMERNFLAVSDLAILLNNNPNQSVYITVRLWSPDLHWQKY